MVVFCVCIDGSPKSHKAYIRAVSLYKEGDNIILLVVVDLVHYMMTNPKASDLIPIAKIKEEMIENGASLIKKYEDLSRDDYCLSKFEGLNIQGTPKEIISEIVEKKSVDVLLLGTVGLMGHNENISLGSTAQYCVRNCTCDVLLCK